MPPEKKLTPPDRNAPVEEHRKHAEEVLTLEYHKKKPRGFKKSDVAVP